MGGQSSFRQCILFNSYADESATVNASIYAFGRNLKRENAWNSCQVLNNIRNILLYRVNATEMCS